MSRALLHLGASLDPPQDLVLDAPLPYHEIMSRRSPEPKPEPGIAEAAENAELRIRVLQSRLAQHDSAAEDLEGELRKLFSTEGSAEVRKRVIDGVVERILREWEGSPLEEEIVERLVERTSERLIAARMPRAD